MKAQRDSASFVLRFTQDHWQDKHGKPHIEWRGHIRHVQDGAERHFVDMMEAMVFIEDCLLRLTENCTQQADVQYREQALRESYRLWERFALMYAEQLAQRLDPRLPAAGPGDGEAKDLEYAGHNRYSVVAPHFETAKGVEGRVSLLRNLISVLEERLDHRPIMQDAPSS